MNRYILKAPYRVKKLVLLQYSRFLITKPYIDVSQSESSKLPDDLFYLVFSI